MYRRMFAACVVVVLSAALATPSEAGRRRLHWVDVALHLAWAGWWLESIPRPVASGVSPSEDMTVVELKVIPDHARVTLDGRLIGIAGDFSGNPDYLYLRPGVYRLDLTLGGYREETFELEARPGRYFPVELTLERVRGQRRTPWWEKPEGVMPGRVFGPPPDAAGPSAESGPDVSLRPELASRAGSRNEVPAGEERGMVLGAVLEFRITPEDAEVTLDGSYLGTAGELGRLERGLAVESGLHRVEVAVPGRDPVLVDVVLEEGERHAVSLDLAETPGDAGRHHGDPAPGD